MAAMTILSQLLTLYDSSNLMSYFQIDSEPAMRVIGESTVSRVISAQDSGFSELTWSAVVFSFPINSNQRIQSYRSISGQLEYLSLLSCVSYCSYRLILELWTCLAHDARCGVWGVGSASGRDGDGLST